MVALASIAFWLGNSQPTKGALRRMLFGFVCVLMVLMKPSALAYLPALCWLGVRGSGSRREKLLHCLLVMSALLAHVVWMRWAWHLLRTYNPAGPIISIQIDLANVWQNLCTPSSYVYLTSFVLPSVVTGYWLFPAGVLGLFHFVYQLRRRSCSVMDEAMGVALVLALIELICFGDRLAYNLYYGLVLLLPSMYFTVQGVRLFASTLQHAPQADDHWLRFFGWSVVLASVAPALRLRHVNTFNSAASAVQGVIENRFIWDFSNLWSVVAMLGVLVGATLLSRMKSPGGWQRSVQVACLTVGACLVGSQYRADQLQWRAIYGGGEERAATTRQLATIREAVELFSTPSQLLGTNHLELAVLAELRRNGEVNLQPPDRRTQRSSGVDLYLFFGEERLRTGYPQLAIGRDWQLFCLRAGGCQ